MTCPIFLHHNLSCMIHASFHWLYDLAIIMHTIRSLNISSVYLYNSMYTLYINVNKQNLSSTVVLDLLWMTSLLIHSRGIDLKISILHVFLYIYNILDIKKRKIIDQLCYILVYKYIYILHVCMYTYISFWNNICSLFFCFYHF